MKQFLMTSPANYGVQYDINPWMTQSLEGDLPIVIRAAQQWAELRNSLVALGADVIVLPKSPDYCPDAVFIGSAGALIGEDFVASRFKHEERAAEEPWFANWFESHDFAVRKIPDIAPRTALSFEGDVMLDACGINLWMGVGQRGSRSFKSALDILTANTQLIVKPLELVDPVFYHLSTCFCPLDTGELLWYPAAFSEYSQTLIDSWFEGRSIELSRVDAMSLAASSISLGENILTPAISDILQTSLTARGYKVITHNMSEFLKSGGGCKCLVLEVPQ